MLINVSGPGIRRLRRALRPIPQPVPIEAVIDTGSPLTCADPQAFASLGLLPTGSISILTASSGPAPILRDQYEVSLTLLHPSGNPALHRLLDPVTITDAPLVPTGIPALLGWDLLRQWVFLSDGPAGTFSLTY
jgi:hypothetical protein